VTALLLRRPTILLVATAAVLAGALAFHLLTPKLQTEPASSRPGERIPVPWHTSTRLVALDLKQTGPHTVEILTRRDGKTGTTYTRRVIDCAERTFRYLGEGTSEAMARAGHGAEREMSPLREGTIPFQVAAYACRGDKPK
jgi:hypothetical protein